MFKYWSTFLTKNVCILSFKALSHLYGDLELLSIINVGNILYTSSKRTVPYSLRKLFAKYVLELLINSEVVGGNKEVETGQCRVKMTNKSSYIRTK